MIIACFHLLINSSTRSTIHEYFVGNFQTFSKSSVMQLILSYILPKTWFFDEDFGLESPLKNIDNNSFSICFLTLRLHCWSTTSDSVEKKILFIRVSLTNPIKLDPGPWPGQCMASATPSRIP